MPYRNYPASPLADFLGTGLHWKQGSKTLALCYQWAMSMQKLSLENWAGGGVGTEGGERYSRVFIFLLEISLCLDACTFSKLQIII